MMKSCFIGFECLKTFLRISYKSWAIPFLTGLKTHSYIFAPFHSITIYRSVFCFQSSRICLGRTFRIFLPYVIRNPSWFTKPGTDGFSLNVPIAVPNLWRIGSIRGRVEIFLIWFVFSKVHIKKRILY